MATGSGWRAVVAVINHNTREDLRACLESLRPSLERVIVFDNRSTDGSAEMVRGAYGAAKLMESEENMGYGAAANRVFGECEEARGAEVLILSNSDVVFTPGAVEGMARALEEDGRVGVVGPKLLNRDGSLQCSCFPLPGGWGWGYDYAVAIAEAWVPRLRGRLPLWYGHDAAREAPWVKGAVMAIRRKAFDEVGGFDERFFMYYEETDLCHRMTKRGWRVRFTPAVEVTHLGGTSTSQVAPAMAEQLRASFLRFAQIHYSVPHAALLRMFWRVVMGLRAARGVD